MSMFDSTPVQQHPAPPPALLAALKRSQEINRELENYVAREDQLFANPHLSATHKLELRAIQRGQTHDEEGRTRINLTTIAEQIGVSPDTVGRGSMPVSMKR